MNNTWLANEKKKQQNNLRLCVFSELFLSIVFGSRSSLFTFAMNFFLFVFFVFSVCFSFFVLLKILVFLIFFVQTLSGVATNATPHALK